MKRTRLLALIALSGFVLGTTCPPTTNNNNNNNSARNVQVDSEATARPADDPAICCEGSNVYVAWAERRTGPGYDILFARSADGGATWTESPTLLNRDAPGISDSRTPIICCDGLNIYVVWLNGPDPVHMYFNSSADGGVTWRDFAVRISGSTPTGFHSFPRICCMGTNVYVSWSDDRAGAGRPDMFFNRSTDGGTTWLQDDTRISSWAPGTDVGLTQHEMCCDGQNVYVSWSDRRNGDYDMWLTRSTDGGEMWPVMETRVDNGATGVNSGPRPTSIACAVAGKTSMSPGPTIAMQGEMRERTCISTRHPTGELRSAAPTAGSTRPILLRPDCLRETRTCAAPAPRCTRPGGTTVPVRTCRCSIVARRMAERRFLSLIVASTLARGVSRRAHGSVATRRTFTLRGIRVWGISSSICRPTAARAG